jgi:hypothetical protein
MKLGWSSVSALVLLTVCPGPARADSISDSLTVSDSLGFSMTVQLMESQEPFGKATIVYPAQVFDLTNPGRTQLSDILSISAITVSVISDSDASPEGGTESPLAPVVITVTAASDQNTAAGVSDTLTVTGQPPKTILEANEPSEVTISVPARSILFGDGGDTLTISAFTANLVSLADTPGADVGTMTDTITINATSDSAVPEPSTLVLVGLALSGLGVERLFRGRARKLSDQ